MDPNLKDVFEQIDKRLNGLGEIGKELKKDIEGLPEETPTADSSSLLLGKLEEVLTLLRPQQE